MEGKEVRFGIVGLVASQLLFLRFPWKMAHLLPSLACLAVLYAVALDEHHHHRLEQLEVAVAVRHEAQLHGYLR